MTTMMKMTTKQRNGNSLDSIKHTHRQPGQTNNYDYWVMIGKQSSGNRNKILNINNHFDNLNFGGAGEEDKLKERAC